MKISKGIQYILVSTVCFAVMNTFVKLLSHFPAHELVFFRSLISFILCFIALRKKQLPIFGNNKKWLIIRGLAGVTALSMFFITLQNMPLANAVTIQYMSPVFTSVLGIFILKEKVKNKQWFWFAVALLGVMVIKGVNPNLEWKWLILGIISALFAGLAYTAVRKCKDTDHPLQVVLYFPMIALPITALFCIFHQWTQPIGIEWLYILIIGISTQIAQIFMTKALHAERVSIITPFKYFGAVLAIGVGFFVFDESLSWMNLVGIILIVCGVLFNSLSKA